MSLTGIVYQVLLPRSDRSGRVAACEVLVATMAIRNLVRQGKTHEIPSYLQTGRDVGMQTLQQSIGDLKTRQLIRSDEAVDHTKDVEDGSYVASPVEPSISGQDPGGDRSL